MMQVRKEATSLKNVKDLNVNFKERFAPANPLQTRLFDVQVAVWASSSVPGG